MRRFFHQFRKIHIGMGVRFMRVDTDAGPDVIFPFGRCDNFAPFAFPSGNIEHRGDTALPGALEHSALLFDQALVVQMAVTIDQHIRPLLHPSAARGAGKSR